MDDEGAPEPALPTEAIDPVPPPLPYASGEPEPSGAALLSADLKGAWSKLDRTAQLLAEASAAVFLLTLVGLPFGVWNSAQFALILLVASIATAVAAWLGGGAAVRGMPIPLATIELAAGLIAAILAVLKVVEILFDLDQLDGSGGIVGLALAIALAAGAVGLLVLVTRRGADLRGAVARGDQGTKVAAIGLGLVVLGWAFNLSISFWTMGQAALPLAVLALATVTIAEASRIEAPVPVAWVGAAIAVFGAILLAAHWGDLTHLGAVQIVLDPADFIGFLGYTAGTAMIIAGGILSGRGEWAARQAPTDGRAGTS